MFEILKNSRPIPGPNSTSTESHFLRCHRVCLVMSCDSRLTTHDSSVHKHNTKLCDCVNTHDMTSVCAVLTSAEW